MRLQSQLQKFILAKWGLLDTGQPHIQPSYRISDLSPTSSSQFRGFILQTEMQRPVYKFILSNAVSRAGT